jgi:5-methylcytosine-specific restriction enzyme A
MSGEKWDCDHRIALINGGEHREHNLRLICAWCHTKKTTEDVAEKSMISKRRKKHLGIKKPTGFRGWRRMDGTVVWNRHKR